MQSTVQIWMSVVKLKMWWEYYLLLCWISTGLASKIQGGNLWIPHIDLEVSIYVVLFLRESSKILPRIGRNQRQVLVEAHQFVHSAVVISSQMQFCYCTLSLLCLSIFCLWISEKLAEVSSEAWTVQTSWPTRQKSSVSAKVNFSQILRLVNIMEKVAYKLYALTCLLLQIHICFSLVESYFGSDG